MIIELDFMRTAETCEVWDRSGKGRYLGCLRLSEDGMAKPSATLKRAFPGLPMTKGKLEDFEGWIRLDAENGDMPNPEILDKRRQLRWG